MAKDVILEGTRGGASEEYSVETVARPAEKPPLPSGPLGQGETVVDVSQLEDTTSEFKKLFEVPPSDVLKPEPVVVVPPTVETHPRPNLPAENYAEYVDSSQMEDTSSDIKQALSRETEVQLPAEQQNFAKMLAFYGWHPTGEAIMGNHIYMSKRHVGHQVYVSKDGRFWQHRQYNGEDKSSLISHLSNFDLYT